MARAGFAGGKWDDDFAGTERALFGCRHRLALVAGRRVGGSVFVGLYMTGLKLSPSRIRLFNWHKWAGVSILLLSVFRLGWRWTHRAPRCRSRLARCNGARPNGRTG
jgi:hypothetical protein